MACTDCTIMRAGIFYARLPCDTHTSIPESAWYFPVGQAWQLQLPSLTLNFPALQKQILHISLLSFCEYLPVGHCMHMVLPVLGW
jgi:hypothetical protein